MTTLVRRIFKVALFFGLCVLSVRYIPLSNEWTPAEARTWWHASEWLGIHDPEDLYFAVWVSIELIVAMLAYIAITRLWRHHRKMYVEK
ncbi:hypothetical protein [Burkholderia territorii]|uniref:hypothetical protein n=1 Tax=Burkholderia territorii TaxID=1503055 RepID=UPI0009BE5237|nr:hypothetical protein [Burkholderia territorii]